MTDGDLFIDEDGNGDLTLWRANGDYPEPLLRICDVPPAGRETVWAIVEEAVGRG